MESITPSNALKTIKIIHFALMGGPVLFSIVAFFKISKSPDQHLIDLENILTFFPIGFAAFLIPLSFFMFNSTLKQNLADKTDLSEKLAAFQTAHIIRIAILEGAALFTIVASFATDSYANFFAFAVLLGIMLISTPSALKLTEALNLTREETALLND